MKTVAIIPARAGSKEIPKKNLISFCGKPLLAWTILDAVACSKIDKVFVSTDCQDIKRCAQEYGANVIDRPSDISGDTASSESALIHACQVISEQYGTTPERIVFLQATSPLRESFEITEALEQFEHEGLDSLFSGASERELFWWGTEGDKVSPLNYDFNHRPRRQEIRNPKKIILETGSFFITKTSLLMKNENRLGGKIGSYLVPLWKGYQIDNNEGLELCRGLMRHYKLDLRHDELERVSNAVTR